LVFDQVLSDSIPIGYSDPRFNDWLGRADDLRLFLVGDRSTVGWACNIVVQESADEELADALWFSSLAGSTLQPESVNFATAIMAALGTTVAAGSDTITMRSGRPSTGFRRIKVELTEGTGTVRVRIWATGRNGYRRFHRLLLSERLNGGNAVYGPHESCAWLNGVDQLSIVAVAEEISGLAPQLILLVGESPNGRSWVEYPGTIPISAGITQLQFAAGITLAVPWSGFIRLGAQLSGTNPAATVKLWVTGRDVRSG
jgi:hypothetical protein